LSLRASIFPNEHRPGAWSDTAVDFYFREGTLMAMPRFSLRTLMIVMLLGGPLLAGAWWNRVLLLKFVQHEMPLVLGLATAIVMHVAFSVLNNRRATAKD
jgi:hypothetical protein